MQEASKMPHREATPYRLAAGLCERPLVSLAFSHKMINSVLNKKMSSHEMINSVLKYNIKTLC